MSDDKESHEVPPPCSYHRMVFDDPFATEHDQALVVRHMRQCHACQVVIGRKINNCENIQPGGEISGT